LLFFLMIGVSSAQVVGEQLAQNMPQEATSANGLLAPGAATMPGYFYYPDATTYALDRAEGFDIFGYPITASTLYQKIEVVRIPAINFAGKLIERGTRRPLADTMVIILETEETAITDGDGFFAFYDVPDGIYTIIVAAIGYRKYQTTEKIEFDQRTDVVYYIDPQFLSPYEIVVTEKREKKEVSKTTLKRQEILKVPGAGGDAIKAVQALPGINLVNEVGGALLVRGSSPGSNAYYFNRVPVPYLNHFGGLRSVFNSEMIERIDFLAGGHGVRYGGSGGVLDIYTRDGRKDRYGGFIDVNTLMTEVLFEGPIGSDKTTFAVSGRRSYLELVLPFIFPGADEVELNAYPVFQDYQIQVTHRPNDDDRYSFYSYGTQDYVSLTITEENPEEPALVGDFVFDSSYYAVGANIDNRISKSWKNYLTPFFYYTEQRADIGLDYYFHLSARSYGLRDILEYKVNDQHKFNFGATSYYNIYSVNTEIIHPPSEGDPYASFSNQETLVIAQKGTIGAYSLFTEYIFTPTEELQLVPGLKVVYSGVNEETVLNARLSGRYQINEKTALKAAWGLYDDYPQYHQVHETFGTPGLEAGRIYHYIAGAERNLGEGIELDLQLYYKDLRNQVSPTGEVDPFYDNSGEGFSYGGEIFLRHSLVDRFFGWISYAYNKSKRNYGGGSYKAFEWDQPHAINIVASYQLTREWEVGAKWRYTSGAPTTPFNNSIYNADTNTYIPYPGATNSERLPEYHRLDTRVEYKFIFDAWLLSTYLELINVYNRRNYAGEDYNYDFSESEYFSILSFMPALGLKASF
jgi:CarboxypepD_reg-like domain/TonB-dependent Receptor Plug Domain